MKFQFSEKQLKDLEEFAHTRACGKFIPFLQSLANQLSDIRNIQERDEKSIAVREEVVNFIENDLVKRLKLFGGYVDPSDEEEFM